jgi:hypothetical protein
MLPFFFFFKEKKRRRKKREKERKSFVIMDANSFSYTTTKSGTTKKKKTVTTDLHQVTGLIDAFTSLQVGSNLVVYGMGFTLDSNGVKTPNYYHFAPSSDNNFSTTPIFFTSFHAHPPLLL